MQRDPELQLIIFRRGEKAHTWLQGARIDDYANDYKQKMEQPEKNQP